MSETSETSMWPPRRFAVRHRSEHGLFVRQLDAGVPAAGTLVYLHGLGESGLCFERLIADPRLACWRQLVPDLPGYGKSCWRADPAPLRQVAELLQAWLVDAAGEPVVLVGHSMGGYLGQLFCETFPQQVRAFVNIEGNLSPGDCVFSGRAAAYDLEGFLADGHRRLWSELHREGVENPVIASYVASLRMCDPRCYHLHSGELVAAAAAEDLARRMAGLDLPRVYIAGDPRGICARSRELLAESAVATIVLGPSGHWPFLDLPEAFAGQLAEFLERV